MEILKRDFELLKNCVKDLVNCKEKEIIQFLIENMEQNKIEKNNNKIVRQTKYRRKKGVLSIEDYRKKQKEELNTKLRKKGVETIEEYTADQYADNVINYVKRREQYAKYERGEL